MDRSDEIASGLFPYIEGDSIQGRKHIFAQRYGFKIGYNLCQPHVTNLEARVEKLEEALKKIESSCEGHQTMFCEKTRQIAQQVLNKQ